MAHLMKSQIKQQGVVLITALIMVIAVTGIAVTLMSSSSIDIKITNAAQEREVAENELIGEVQRVIAEEANKGAANQFFLSVPRKSLRVQPTDKHRRHADRRHMMVCKAKWLTLNKGALDLECPRGAIAAQQGCRAI